MHASPAQADCCTQRLASVCDAVAGPAIRLEPEGVALLRRLQRLYFLNEGHDISR